MGASELRQPIKYTLLLGTVPHRPHISGKCIINRHRRLMSFQFYTNLKYFLICTNIRVCYNARYKSERCMLSALFMIRDCEFLDTVTDEKDKSAYIDEWEIIAPKKLEMLKKRIKDKFKEVLISSHCLLMLYV